jgi:hypothetical protein
MDGNSDSGVGTSRDVIAPSSPLTKQNDNKKKNQKEKKKKTPKRTARPPQVKMGDDKPNTQWGDGH